MSKFKFLFHVVLSFGLGESAFAPHPRSSSGYLVVAYLLWLVRCAVSVRLVLFLDLVLATSTVIGWRPLGPSASCPRS